MEKSHTMMEKDLTIKNFEAMVSHELGLAFGRYVRSVPTLMALCGAPLKKYIKIIQRSNGKS